LKAASVGGHLAMGFAIVLAKVRTDDRLFFGPKLM